MALPKWIVSKMDILEASIPNPNTERLLPSLQKDLTETPEPICIMSNIES
jgi:hypothetical protein